MKNILVPVSFLTLACACWLILMEALLRHPGFAWNIAVDSCVAAICAATILARLFHAGLGIERWLRFSSAVLIYMGGRAFIHNARSAHFEGFVFVISLLVLFQGALMLVTLEGIRPPIHQSLKP